MRSHSSDLARAGHGQARWPYGLGLASAVLAAAGLAYAPFSAIVYAIAIPGVTFSAVWALAHHSSQRLALAVSAGLLIAGLITGAVALLALRSGPVAGGPDYASLIESLAWVVLLVVPALALLLGIPSEAAALRPQASPRLSSSPTSNDPAR